MKSVISVLMLLAATIAGAQPTVYTVSNLHSHNDYEKPRPYWEAYNQGYGSIEADIFLYKTNLIIAHDTVQRAWGRTLDSFYLAPLARCIKSNNGYPYSDHNKKLQLLVDIKTDSILTLNRLVEKLQAYPVITGCAAVKIVITGNRPAATLFNHYPSYIYFDGELSVAYSPEALGKIEMLSDNFKRYSYWNGLDSLSAKDKTVISKLITDTHQHQKKVRFWNAPDNSNSWRIFMGLGVDYINTDHITGAANFINQLQQRQ